MAGRWLAEVAAAGTPPMAGGWLAEVAAAAAAAPSSPPDPAGGEAASSSPLDPAPGELVGRRRAPACQRRRRQQRPHPPHAAMTVTVEDSGGTGSFLKKPLWHFLVT
uniref:Uncharacterized protein n=1 Tax=Oryza glaberrima TaxID=4538 RepID=I1PT34_ORYGL